MTKRHKGFTQFFFSSHKGRLHYPICIKIMHSATRANSLRYSHNTGNLSP